MSHDKEVDDNNTWGDVMKPTNSLTLGEKLKQTRIIKGLSQENVAFSANSSASVISRIERGQLDCPPEMLKRIREYLEIEHAPLLDNERDTFLNRLWIWHEMIATNRFAEAKAACKALSQVTFMPYEQNMSQLYNMIEARLLLSDKNYQATIERLNAFEPYVDEADAATLFLYHRNKAVLLVASNDYKDATSSLLALLEIKSSEISVDAGVWNLLGYCSMQLSKPIRAILYYERARADYNFDRTHTLQLSINISLASAYVVVGELEQARSLLSAAIHHARGINIIPAACAALVQFGVICHIQKNYSEGLNYCEQALEGFLQDAQEGGKYPNQYKELYIQTLYGKALCLLGLKRIPQFLQTVDEGKKEAIGSEVYSIIFKALGHLVNLQDIHSYQYITDTAIPYLKNCDNIAFKLAAVELCKAIESHFKKRAVKKSLIIAAIIRDIYEEVFRGL